MKKLSILLAVFTMLLMTVPASAGWVGEASYYNYSFELRPEYPGSFSESASQFGSYYMGYDSGGNWEFGLSYLEWSKELDVAPGYSEKVTLYPTIVYATYKFISTKSQDWEPMIGLGYGSVRTVFSGKYTGLYPWSYHESHRYDVFSFFIGTRYYFQQNWGVTLKYMRYEVYPQHGLVLGSGFNFGVVYRFK